MKKRIVSLLLALTLLASLAVTAGAAKYSDLEGHWSESYIMKLSELGYLSGYPDGTMQPDKSITACEAIALLSRFYPVDDSVAQLIHMDYGDFVSSNIDPTLKWAYEEIEICLAAGIISEKELRSLRLTNTIDKELLSVLLVRALQLTDKAAALVDDGVTLSFDDADEIAAAYRGHIAVLVNNKIVQGDTRNNFTPHAEVTRGVVATMVVRGLEYVESLGSELTIPGYAKTRGHDGVLTAVGASSLTLRDTAGVSRSYALASGAAITLGGKTAALTDLTTGSYVTARVENGLITSAAVRSEEGRSWAQGAAAEYARAASGYSLRLQSLEDGKTVSLAVPESAGVTVDGVKKTAADLRTGMFLTVAQQGGRVTGVTAASGSYTASGVISALTYGAPVYLELTTEDGGRVRYGMDLADLPEITRGGSTAGIERLTVGDEVTLTVRDCVLTKIAAKAAAAATLEGVLTSAIATTAGTTWLITDSQNESHSLTVDPSASANQAGKAILISAVQVGDTISVVTDGKVITEVTVRASGSAGANALTGTVLAVNAKAKTVTVLTQNNRLVYVDTSEAGSIINAKSGKTINVSAVEVNTQLRAYGEYKDASNFQAKSIILEG